MTYKEVLLLNKASITEEIKFEDFSSPIVWHVKIVVAYGYKYFAAIHHYLPISLTAEELNKEIDKMYRAIIEDIERTESLKYEED